jgi:hypothetical protein
MVISSIELTFLLLTLKKIVKKEKNGKHEGWDSARYL